MIERENAILLPGSLFDNPGGWISDPQFMEVMGSSELLAHGLVKPVADACTGFEVPTDGVYNVWVRTKNWAAWWTDRPGPGKFTLRFDGRPLDTVFGTGSPVGKKASDQRDIAKQRPFIFPARGDIFKDTANHYRFTVIDLHLG